MMPGRLSIVLMLLIALLTSEGSMARDGGGHEGRMGGARGDGFGGVHGRTFSGSHGGGLDGKHRSGFSGGRGSNFGDVHGGALRKGHGGVEHFGGSRQHDHGRVGFFIKPPISGRNSITGLTIPFNPIILHRPS